MASNTEVEFEKQWKELSNSFDSKPNVLEYLSNKYVAYIQGTIYIFLDVEVSPFWQQSYITSRRRPCAREKIPATINRGLAVGAQQADFLKLSNKLEPEKYIASETS